MIKKMHLKKVTLRMITDDHVIKFFQQSL